MLRALQDELLAVMSAEHAKQTCPMHTLRQAQSLLQQSSTYQHALQQLCDRDVKGCVKDLGQAALCKQKGNAAYKEGKLQAALQLYNDALKALPSSSCIDDACKLYTNRAMVLLKLTPPAAAEAEDNCTAALALDNTNIKAWYWRAAARKLQGAHQLATADGEQALLLSTQLQITGSTQDVLLLMQQLKNLSCPDSVSPVVDSSAPEPASAVAAAPPAAKVCALDIPIIQRSGNIPHDQLSHGELQPANGPDISQLNHLLAAHLVPPGNDAGLQQCNGRQDGQHQHAVNTQNQQQQQQQQQQEQPAHQPASYASAQARICVAYSESQGRHVIAAANIPAAEDVVLELPVAAVPVKQARKTHCWRCYKRLGSAPFYCSGCQQALYCSRQCPSSDTAHSSPGVPECGLPWPLLLPEELWLALRLVASAAGMTAADPQQQQQQQQRQGEQGTQQHPAYQQPQEQAVTMQPCSIEECMEKQRDKAGLRGASNQCYVSLLQSLESHVTDSSREQLMHWVLLACVGADMHATCYKAELLHDHKSAAAHQLELSIKNITAASCVSRRPDDGTVCHVSAEALLQALGQIAANGIAVRPAATAGVDQRLAVAMYPVCSMFNHDCDANCVMRWGHDWLLTRSQSCGL
eukprot:jgi/Chrzof1/2563/Cz11g20140.t1